MKRDKGPGAKHLPEVQPRHANAKPGESVDPDPLFITQEYVAEFELARINEHPANPNEADLGELHTLIGENGFYGAMIVQRQTPDGELRWRLLAGHGRRNTLLQKSRKHGPVFLIDVDDETAARILLGDNAGAKKASTNEDTLSRVLQMLNAKRGHLRGTGYDTDDLQDVLGRLNSKGAAEQVNEFTKAAKDASAGWPIISIRVPHATLGQFSEVMRRMDGETPHEKLDALLALVDTRDV